MTQPKDTDSGNGSAVERLVMPDAQVLPTWIILRKPGKNPESKRPVGGECGLIKMLRDLFNYHPEAQLTIIRIAFGNDIWVEDGQTYLNIHDTM